MPPHSEWFCRIHERLLAGDPTASAELAETTFDALTAVLAKRNPRISDAALIDEAVAEALLSYIKRPDTFDSGKAGLFGYLQMSAQGDLVNALAKLSRRRKREKPLEAVEVGEFAGKEHSDGPDLVSNLEAQRIQRQLDEVFDNPKDREMVDLVVDRERSTEAFSVVLGIESLPIAEQREQVKRHKDRIKKRLKLLGETIREEER